MGGDSGAGCFVNEIGFAPKRSANYLTCLKASFPEPEIVTRKGKPVSVILAIKDDQELLERVEDAEDVAALKRVRRKPVHYRPLEAYLADRSRA